MIDQYDQREVLDELRKRWPEPTPIFGPQTADAIGQISGRITFGPKFIKTPMVTEDIAKALNIGVKSHQQVGGTHYGNPNTDVYAFAMANDLDAMQFNVVKYVTRFRKKNGLQDLQKAKHTLERLIAHELAKGAK